MRNFKLLCVHKSVIEISPMYHIQFFQIWFMSLFLQDVAVAAVEAEEDSEEAVVVAAAVEEADSTTEDLMKGRPTMWKVGNVFWSFHQVLNQSDYQESMLIWMLMQSFFNPDQYSRSVSS